MRSQLPALRVVEWAALVWRLDVGAEPQMLGSALAEADIPAAFRRRMASYERAVARCVLGACGGAGNAEITLGSRYGNLSTAVSLLTSIAKGEPMSPMGFSMSVHNAACGLLDQLRKDRSPHTAVAAGVATPAAALTEVFLRTGDSEPGTSHVVVIGDTPMPLAYRAFDDEPGAAIAVAMRVKRANALAETAVEVDTIGTGRKALARIIHGLTAGARRFEMSGASWCQRCE